MVLVSASSRACRSVSATYTGMLIEMSAVAGVAGLREARMVAAHEALELRDRRRAGRYEEGQPHAADHREGLLRRGRHADGRMRPLMRLGHDADVVELEVLALVGEALLRPRRLQDLERLEEPLTALAVGNVEALVVTGEPA